MRLDKATFTVFDVETTGLYPYSGDRICEIGAVKAMFGSRETKKFHSMINPGRPISYGAFRVNGITDEMVMGAPTIYEILPSFLKFIEGSVLVAYNAGFDLGFLECALRNKKDVLNDYYVIDALRLARRLFPSAGRFSLSCVSQSLGIDTEGGHRALSDAVMTWKVFGKELKLLMEDGIREVEELAKAQVKKSSIAVVGDYKLKLIEEAIREEKRLNITYRSVWDNRITKRVITPKEIQSGYDKSYVVAHCHLRNDERNFRLDCILEAEEA